MWRSAKDWYLKLKYVRLHYKHFGPISTIKTFLKKFNDLSYEKLVGLFMFFSGDYLREKYYFKDKNVISHFRKTKGLKIGVIRKGGIGDCIVATSLITAIKEEWPESYIYLFVSSKNKLRLLERFKAIDRVIIISEKIDFGRASLELELANKLSKEYLDIIFLDRYVIKSLFKEGTPIKSTLDKIFHRYNLNFYSFPHNANRLLAFHKDEYELRSVSAGLDISSSKLAMILEDIDYACSNNLPFSFVTIHHGADNKMYFKRKDNLQTKNWFAERWKMVVEFIKSKGYDVVQIGILSDEYIHGTIDMRGKTSVTEAAAILKKSILHLDTEGGIVHLAKAVGTKSVVLFGPTAVEFYGYKDNINIRGGNCRNCWWSTPDWQARCPLDFDVPKCMETIDIKTVIDSVSEFIELRKNIDCKLALLNSALFTADLIEKNVSILSDVYKLLEIRPLVFNKNAYNETTGAYIHGSKNWEYLYVLDCIKTWISPENKIRALDAGAGRGALQVYLASKNNFELYSCDLDYNDLSPYGENYGKTFLKKYHNLIKFRFCSIFNLPYEDEYFDIVYCVSVMEHFQNKKYALKELLRVLKADGILILTFDIATLSHLKILTDKYRIDIFTNSSLKELLKKELNINLEMDDSMVDISVKEIASSKIEGVPYGLTVGGLCIRKTS